MTPPRVLSVIHGPSYGGPHGRNRTLSQLFAAQGTAALTVALPDGPAAQRLRAEGVDVRTLPLGRLRARGDPALQLRYLAGWPGDVARLTRLIRQTGADVVLLNGLANPQAAVAARRAGVALVWQLLDTRSPPVLARLLRPAVRAWADCVMATGAPLARDQLGLPAGGDGALAGRLVAFAPPVDPARFRPAAEVRRAARAELGVAGRPVVGLLANLTPQKGHDAFLDAAALLRRRRPDVRFVWLGERFAGQGGYADRLLARARRLGLDDLVVRAPGGRVGELAQAFDVAWLTSPPRSEGIPTAAGELMCLGVPLAAFRVGAVSALVEHGRTGLLLAPGDTAGLAAATVDLLGDPGRRAALAAAGRDRAERVCAPGACADAHLRAFEIARAHRDAGAAGTAARRADVPPVLDCYSKHFVCERLGGIKAMRPKLRRSRGPAAGPGRAGGGAAGAEIDQNGGSGMTRMGMNRQDHPVRVARAGAFAPAREWQPRAGAATSAPVGQGRLKILILALNSAPDLVGAGRCTGDMASWLAARGHRVEVVAAPPFYPGWRVAAGYRGLGYRREHDGGVVTMRCPLYVPRQPGAGRRVLHQLSFALSSLPVLVGRALAARPDVVLTVAPATLAAPNAWLAARLSGAQAWLHVQDLELDTAVELGLLPRGRARRGIARVERWLLGRFDRITTIGSGMARRLAAKGANPARLGVLANWVDCRSIRPLPDREISRASFGLPSAALVALYSGSLGDKQGLEALIAAAERLVHRRDLHIAVFGDGPGRGRLLEAAAQLPNLSVGPLVPAERLNDLLNCADVHLLPQVAGIEELVLPSKLTHMLASGRPVVAAAPPGSDLAEMVADCGICVRDNTGASFARALTRLAEDPVLCRSLGHSARERAVEQLDRAAVLGRLERALLDATRSARAVPDG
jgi:colanic acid biosynthesis glycosyl transferase WcaI